MYATETVGRGSALGAGAAPSVPRNPSCFGTIENVCGQSHEVAMRVAKLADRLCGSEPANEANGKNVGPDGLFSGATDHALTIQANFGRILEAVTRIERGLP